jgi:hypothetical protein
MKFFTEIDSSRQDGYYAELEKRDVGEKVLEKAIDFLIENRTHKYFPSFAEILDAVDEVRRRYKFTEYDFEPCGLCEDTGFRIEKRVYPELGPETRETAVPCSCQQGQFRKRQLKRQAKDGKLAPKKYYKYTVVRDQEEIKFPEDEEPY